MRQLTMFRVGDQWAVFHEGGQTGVISPTRIRKRRMWRADGTDGRRGVFSTRRDAAQWLNRRG